MTGPLPRASMTTQTATHPYAQFVPGGLSKFIP